MNPKFFHCTWYLYFCMICISSCVPISSEKPVEELRKLSTQEIVEMFADYKTVMLPAAADVLAERPQDAQLSAPVLAKALQFPRRDSYEAGIALIKMGEVASPAIPYLIQALTNRRREVREYAAFALGSIGEKSSCAIPSIAPLLWDEDDFVRASAAGAIDHIAGLDLVNDYYQSDPAKPRSSIYPDSPEGFITGETRNWWVNEGQKIDWLNNNSNCISPPN